jgi:hypothetical protein
MHKRWAEQGCIECRKAWESGAGYGLRELGTSNLFHARLYQCNACLAYWEENERFSHEIPEEEAQLFLVQVEKERRSS